LTSGKKNDLINQSLKKKKTIEYKFFPTFNVMVI